MKKNKKQYVYSADFKVWEVVKEYPTLGMVEVKPVVSSKFFPVNEIFKKILDIPLNK